MTYSRTIMLDIVAVAIAGVLLLFAVFSEYADPPIVAEAVAEDVGPRLGVPADRMRTTLTEWLSEGQTRRAVVAGVLPGILVCLLAVRLVMDVLTLRPSVRARFDSSPGGGVQSGHGEQA